MATPRKKTKAAAKRTTPKTATAAKRSAHSGHTSPTGPASGRSPANRARAGRAPKPPVRERLNTVKPSGGKDDSFFDLVHQVARQIPKGRVTSYGAIAAALGTRMSARMVGWAMMAVPFAEESVPAHRVVNRAGLLTGKHHYNPPGKMQELLEKEGVKVKDDKVVEFKHLFWDPAKEL